MKASKPRQAAYALIAVIVLLYVSSYLWIRHQSLSEFLSRGGRPYTEIHLGVLKSDLSMSWVNASPEKVERFDRRVRLIRQAYVPLIWIDEKITSTEILDHREW